MGYTGLVMGSSTFQVMRHEWISVHEIRMRAAF